MRRISEKILKNFLGSTRRLDPNTRFQNVDWSAVKNRHFICNYYGLAERWSGSQQSDAYNFSRFFTPKCAYSQSYSYSPENQMKSANWAEYFYQFIRAPKCWHLICKDQILRFYSASNISASDLFKLHYALAFEICTVLMIFDSLYDDCEGCPPDSAHGLPRCFPHFAQSIYDLNRSQFANLTISIDYP